MPASDPPSARGAGADLRTALSATVSPVSRRTAFQTVPYPPRPSTFRCSNSVCPSASMSLSRTPGAATSSAERPLSRPAVAGLSASAPAAINASTTSGCPLSVAQCSGVAPKRSAALTLAPPASSAVTAGCGARCARARRTHRTSNPACARAAAAAPTACAAHNRPAASRGLPTRRSASATRAPRSGRSPRRRRRLASWSGPSLAPCCSTTRLTSTRRGRGGRDEERGQAQGGTQPLLMEAGQRVSHERVNSPKFL
eukprot:1436184-Prymnesium_polylepis.2